MQPPPVSSGHASASPGGLSALPQARRGHSALSAMLVRLWLLFMTCLWLHQLPWILEPSYFFLLFTLIWKIKGIIQLEDCWFIKKCIQMQEMEGQFILGILRRIFQKIYKSENNHKLGNRKYYKTYYSVCGLAFSPGTSTMKFNGNSIYNRSCLTPFTKVESRVFELDWKVLPNPFVSPCHSLLPVRNHSKSIILPIHPNQATVTSLCLVVCTQPSSFQQCSSSKSQREHDFLWKEAPDPHPAEDLILSFLDVILYYPKRSTNSSSLGSLRSEVWVWGILSTQRRVRHTGDTRGAVGLLSGGSDQWGSIDNPTRLHEAKWGTYHKGSGKSHEVKKRSPSRFQEWLEERTLTWDAFILLVGSCPYLFALFSSFPPPHLSLSPLHSVFHTHLMRICGSCHFGQNLYRLMLFTLPQQSCALALNSSPQILRMRLWLAYFRSDDQCGSNEVAGVRAAAYR